MLLWKIISMSFGFIGSILLVFFGVPGMTEHDTFTSLAIHEEGWEEKERKLNKKLNLYKFLSKFAAVCISFSFLSQLIILFFE